ncbi:ABC transporter permease [Halorussus ruber]|uniref:ABC transporter permease n=1 Tax=Halorussus ruber TaxID=1126238 RepID=UPI0010932358|nr:ABC transporter permease [Halorussus ruber]
MSLLRRLFPRTYMARRNLLRAKARSGLAVLTIIIGVVAIASLGSFGVAFQEAQTDAIGGFGNELLISPGEDNGQLLDERDRRDVERLASGKEVIPLLVAQWQLESTGETVTVRGVGNPKALYQIREGSIPDSWRSGAIVGSEFAEKHEIEPGQSIRLDGRTYRVQAVLEEEGQTSVANPNEAVVVPPGEIDVDGYNNLVVKTESPREASALADEIRANLNERKERVDVLDFSKFAEQFDQAFRQIRMFLLGVGGISLLVAGISIANVMLMSAIERREEIGVLRAVGYQRIDVLGIMLAEAMLLGIIGAIVGVALSLLATMGINSLMLDGPFDFRSATVMYMVLAFAFGIGASIVAGLYPAWKASSKRPVEALRG